MVRRAYVLIPLILLISLIGYRLAQKRASVHAQARQRATLMKAPPVVTVSEARRQDIVQRYEGVGSVDAPLSVKIAAKVTGRIDYLKVREGDRVAKGEVLVRMDPSQVEANVGQAKSALAEAQYRLAQAQITQRPNDVNVKMQVQQQEAALESARADVRSAEANLANAQTRYKRLQTLYEKGFIAAQDVDDAKTAAGVQKAAVDAAQAKVAQAQAALEYARANTAQTPAYEQSLAALRAAVAQAKAAVRNAEVQRADTVLLAPLDGFVTDRLMDPGAVATAGQPILAVQFMREVWVTVPVPEELSGKLHLGAPAEITLDSVPGRKFAGAVSQINPSADPQSRQFLVRVTLGNPDNLIKPGTFARVAIQTEHLPGAVVVPREAVQQGKDGSFVVVVDQANIAHRRRVTLGASDVDVIAVAAGLQPGERVVTLSTYPLRDGQAVQVAGSGKAKAEAGRRS